jgi:hypothetical protein
VVIVLNDKLRRAIKTGIIDEDYKDYLAVEEISHDFSERYEQRMGELVKTNRKSGHRHIKITLRFAAAIIAAVLGLSERGGNKAMNNVTIGPKEVKG